MCLKDSPTPTPVESIADVVARPISNPLSNQEDKLVTSLVRRKMAQASEDGLLQLKTGGQVDNTHIYYCNSTIDINSQSPWLKRGGAGFVPGMQLPKPFFLARKS